MIEQRTVPSVPWMPERAWTTCVSHGCISGLARANYVPFAPQPYPPGMTRAEYEALSPVPAGEEDTFLLEDGGALLLEDGDDLLLEASELGFGGEPPIDCFPRYVMWREDARRPDFEGGELRIEWLRNPGWDYRMDCVIPGPPPVCDLSWNDSSPWYSQLAPMCAALGDPTGDIVWQSADVVGGSGDYSYLWEIWFEGPIVAWVETTQNVQKTYAEILAKMNEVLGGLTGQCSATWRHTVTDNVIPACSLVFEGEWDWCCV